MKRIVSILTIMALAAVVAAQTTTYRQNLQREINHLTVSGNCIVRLSQDSCNWVAYKGAALSDTARLVVIEGNHLTTTPAADNMTLYVGTSAGRGGTSAQLTFDAKGNALIFFNGKVYENGHFSIASESGHTIATESIAQQKKYNASHRFHLDYFFGACRWITPHRNPTKMEALNSISAKLAYSPIMNDRIGAGFGAQIHLNSYLFSSPNTNLTSTDGALTFEGFTSPTNGSWESTMTVLSIDIPLHFTYFPISNKHSINYQLELIPQFILNNTFTRNFNTTVSDQNISASYAQDVPANHFQLMARLSANFGMLGVYTEVGLTPIVNDVLFPPPAVPFSPHHIAFGFRINLFNALAD